MNTELNCTCNMQHNTEMGSGGGHSNASLQMLAAAKSSADLKPARSPGETAAPSALPLRGIGIPGEIAQERIALALQPLEVGLQARMRQPTAVWLGRVGCGLGPLHP